MLTGGGAQLPGLADYAQSALGRPVRPTVLTRAGMDVREAWKAVDRVEPRPVATWRIRVAHGATVVHYALDARGRLTDTRRYPWTGHDSGAPCGQPVVKRGACSGQATVAHVTAGVFRGRWVRIGAGVTASSTNAASPQEVPA